MGAGRRTERWAGVFYIAATIMPILTISFTGFLGGAVAGEPIPDYLAHLSVNEGSVIIGVFVELAWALATQFRWMTEEEQEGFLEAESQPGDALADPQEF